MVATEAAAENPAAAARATTTDVPDLRAVVGTWGAPPDGVALVALGLSVALTALAAAPEKVRAALGARVFDVALPRFSWIVGSLAALASLGYVALYLRGYPRIVDATSYLLEARSLAHGSFTFPADFPSAATRGRFLVYDETTGRLGGIFPPGYPLVLALGVKLGTPLVVGPVLAALIALVTLHLGTRVAEDLRLAHPERTGRLAAMLSLVCATLRYHTADTMSHGLSALYVGSVLLFLFEWRTSRKLRFVLAASVGTGLLFATRPVSGLALFVVFAGTVVATEGGREPPDHGESRREAPLLGLVALGGLVPGLVLLCAWQKALTGSYLGSPQLLYYARSDTPAGCFRYGFGAGIGCLFEHGDFVRHNLPNGYGAYAALATTARRLKMHLADAANLELFVPVVLLPFFRAKGTSLRVLGGMLVAQLLVYVPFYFDGNYPGGGARFYADTLPVEHVLLAVGVTLLAHEKSSETSKRPSSTSSLGTSVRSSALVLALALFGFAVHTSHDHQMLATREEGVPFFDPDVLTRSDVHEGLVFVDTDHGFSLGHVPGAKAMTEVRVVRRREDAHDWLAFDAAGRPPSWLYLVDHGSARVVPWAPERPEGALRFEAETDWPALSQEGGAALPTWLAGASNGRTLTLTPENPANPARTTLALPLAHPGAYRLVPRVHAPRGSLGEIHVAGETWRFEGADILVELPPKIVRIAALPARTEVVVTLGARNGPVSLDRILADSVYFGGPAP